MQHIIPAIIPQTFDHLTDVVNTVSPFSDEIQIDIVDGAFVPFTSWPYRGGGSVMLLRSITEECVVEVDLMISEPERAVPLYVEAGVRKIVVHIESVRDIDVILQHRRESPYLLGLSVNNDSGMELILPYLDQVDYVQLMGIRHIGSQGQPFDDEVLTRISFIKEQYPKLQISIDGSVNTKTVERLVGAGADRLVTGSAILGSSDPEAAYRALEELYLRSINTKTLG
jgi:ribulose-phosphate 3-epimerase